MILSCALPLLLLLTAAPGWAEKKGEDKKGAGKSAPVIYATNYPLKFFAEKIGGKHVAAKLLPPAGVDPAHWRPDGNKVAELQKAALVLINGAGYEKWLPQVSLSPGRVVDTSAPFADRLIVDPHAITHSHGPAGKHSHEGTAFTTWLDLDQAKLQAKQVEAALVKLLPEHKKDFEKNAAELAEKLDEIDRDLLAIFSAAAKEFFVMSHPVYQYFVRRYVINAHSVHWEPNEPATDEQWKKLEAILKDHPARWMIWEGNPTDQKTLDKLRAKGLTSIVFAPLGNAPKQGDFISGMQQNVDNLKRELGGRI